MSRRRRRLRTDIAAPAVLLGALLAAPVVEATVVRLAEPYPLAGTTTAVEVVADDGRPIAGATVEVLYRPNSEAASRTSLGATDAAGRARWRPAEAGLARLTVAPPGAASASLDVAVRRGGMPVPGLVVLTAAAVLLFGGAGLGLVLLLRGSAPASPST